MGLAPQLCVFTASCRIDHRGRGALGADWPSASTCLYPPTAVALAVPHREPQCLKTRTKRVNGQLASSGPFTCQHRACFLCRLVVAYRLVYQLCAQRHMLLSIYGLVIGIVTDMNLDCTVVGTSKDKILSGLNSCRPMAQSIRYLTVMLIMTKENDS